MLVAWARGKKSGEHLGYEDEIVSAVFGPLRYFPEEMQGEFFRRLIALYFPEAAAWPAAEGGTNSCRLEFWPNLSAAGRVEPDIVVHFSTRTARRVTLVIEAKWKAPLHEGQLDDQWNHALATCGDSHVLHLFLAREVGQFPSEAPSEARRRACSANATWSSFAYLIDDVPRWAGKCMEIWAEDVRRFLRSRGHQAFHGFGAAANPTRDAGFSRNRYVFQPRLIDPDRLCRAWPGSRNHESTRWKFTTKAEK